MIRCEELGWTAEGKPILSGISLEIGRGECFGVIGPSGSGKSSLIRILDLLEPPSAGRLFIGGEPVGLQRGTDLVRLRRRMSMVFQRPAVFRMTVFETVAMPLRIRGGRGRGLTAHIEGALDRVGLSGYGERRAHTLSGGELQRVAIARALATDPDVLFLDEPTANLDPLSTTVIEDVIRELHRAGMTIVMATHNLDQGQRLCDRLAVMAKGRLVQVGSPLKVFYHPRTVEVAQFVGAENLVAGAVESILVGATTVRVGDVLLDVEEDGAEPGEQVFVAIRPEEIVLLPGAECRPGARNHLRGIIQTVGSDGPLLRIEIDCGFPLVALVRRMTCLDLGLVPGIPVCAEFRPKGAHLIREEARIESSKDLSPIF